MVCGEVGGRELSDSQGGRVLGDSFKAHAAAELLKEGVVGVGHGLGEVHVLPGAQLEHGVARDDVLFESSDGDGRLDRGARNVAVSESNFLIHGGKNATCVGFDGNNGAIVAAESFDGRFANDGIVKSGDVGAERISKSGNAAVA